MDTVKDAKSGLAKSSLMGHHFCNVIGDFFEKFKFQGWA